MLNAIVYLIFFGDNIITNRFSQITNYYIEVPLGMMRYNLPPYGIYDKISLFIHNQMSYLLVTGHIQAYVIPDRLGQIFNNPMNVDFSMIFSVQIYFPIVYMRTKS